MPSARHLLDALLRAIPGRDRDDPDRLAHEVVRLYESGRFAEAQAAASRLVDRQRQRLGADHPEYATALTNLAILHQRQGDLPAAESHLRQALDIRLASFGETHPQVAFSLNHLAEVLQARGDLDAAEPLMRQALDILRRSPGEDHPDYANGLTGLALLLHRRGDHREAEPLLRQALAIRKAVLGEDHPAYATALSNAGLVLHRGGDLDAAEPLLREAHEVRHRVLGEHHPDTVASLGHLRMLLSGRDAPAPAPDPLPPPAIATAPTPPARPASESADAARALALQFEAVAARLADAARILHDDGLPPDLALLDDAAFARRSYVALRDDAARLAESLGLTPAPDHPPLPALIRLLDDAAREQAERPRREAEKAQALALIDRALALRHVDPREAACLAPCHDQAAGLRDILASHPPHARTLPPEAAPLLDGSHPLATLLLLVESGPSLDDDGWSAAHRIVAESHGRPLAAAAVRGRLRQPTPPDPLDLWDASLHGDHGRLNAPLRIQPPHP